jgi:predicted DNA-binding protein
LTSIPGTVTARRMGRPSMNVKETKVRLNDDQRERIAALVGKNKMAEFIREAVERELKRREKVRQ